MHARRYAFLHEEDNILHALGIEDSRGNNLDNAICAEVDRIDLDKRDVIKSEAFERILNATIPTNEVEAFYVGYHFAQKVKETNARSTLIALALLTGLLIINICLIILLWSLHKNSVATAPLPYASWAT